MSDIYGLLAETEIAPIGEMVSSFLTQNDITLRHFSSATGIQRGTLDRIINGEAQKIDIITLIKICNFFDLDLNYVIRSYVANLPSEDIGLLEQSRKAGFLARTFDLKNLKEAGIISSTTDFEQIETSLLDKLGLESIYQYKGDVQHPLFSSTKRAKPNRMLEFWVATAFQQCKLISNPNPFDLNLLEKILPSIKRLTLDTENGLLKASRALYAAGVTVFAKSYIKGINIRGATMLHREKPFIILSNFNKRYDTIWFSLLHEVYHVLRHLNWIESGYHISGDVQQDIFINSSIEDEANLFASQFLVPNVDRIKLLTYIDADEYIERYAQTNGVHSSIIYGQICKEQENPYLYKILNSKIINSKSAISPLFYDFLSNESLEISSMRIQQQLQTT